MSPPSFQELSAAEQKWISEQMAAGDRFLKRFAPHHEGQLTLQSLDDAWSAWMATGQRDTSEVNEAINCIGIPFGSLLVSSGAFNWCIATDDYGTDLAVRALPDRGNVVVFPANFVSKRWEDGVTDFLADCYVQILDHVSSLKTEWDQANPSTFNAES